MPVEPDGEEQAQPVVREVAEAVSDAGDAIDVKVTLPWRAPTAKPEPVVEYKLQRSTEGKPFRIISAADLPDPRN